MIIGKKGLANFVKGRIEELKALEVPKMVREGNIQALKEVLKKENYEPFRKRTQPEFTVEELGLKDAEDGEACAFYVWGNPYVLGGDTDFFKDILDFPLFLREKCGEWGEQLYQILTDTNPLNGTYIILSKYACKDCRAITLEEFLNPELLIKMRYMK